MKSPFRNLRKNKDKKPNERDLEFLNKNYGFNSLNSCRMSRNRLTEISLDMEHMAMQSPGEFYPVIERIDSMRPRSILELGVICGGTLKIWDEILEKDGLLVGVDYEPGNVNWNYEDSENNIHLVRGNTQDSNVYEKVKKILNGRKFDVLFHDAAHSLPTVKDDIELYGSLVREGGLIVISDLIYVYDWWKQLGVASPATHSKNFWHKEEIMAFTGTGFMTKLPGQTIIKFKE